MTTTPIRWGILGPGSIAHSFVKGLQVLPDAQVAAAGSRDRDRAAAFARQYDIPHAHGSYEDLARDPDVDIIYVATPHPAHLTGALMAIEAGKAVLVEKPFTVNATEAAQLIDAARRARVFAMEAMWSRFVPAMVKVRGWLASGAPGQILQVKADFGFRSGWDPDSRLLNRELGGGALLDVGVYTLSFASMVLGAQPSRISGMAHIGATGVDEQFFATLGYGEDVFASISGAVRASTPHDAWIVGTQGRIHIPQFWRATSATLSIEGKPDERIDCPIEATGYNYEAAEAMRCMRAGMLESDTMPLDETLAIMKTMDTIRQPWGLRYPGE